MGAKAFVPNRDSPFDECDGHGFTPGAQLQIRLVQLEELLLIGTVKSLSPRVHVPDALHTRSCQC